MTVFRPSRILLLVVLAAVLSCAFGALAERDTLPLLDYRTDSGLDNYGFGVGRGLNFAMNTSTFGTTGDSYKIYDYQLGIAGGNRIVIPGKNPWSWGWSAGSGAGPPSGPRVSSVSNPARRSTCWISASVPSTAPG